MRRAKTPGTTSIYCDPRTSQRKKKINHKAERLQANIVVPLLLRKPRKSPKKRLRKKTCTNCHLCKWLSQFRRPTRHGKLDRYQSHCYECEKYLWCQRSASKRRAKRCRRSTPAAQEWQRNYRAKNPEKVKAWRRTLLAKNPKYFVDKNREYNQRKKERDRDAVGALEDKDCT